jgi:hypothetical protein
MKIPHIAIGFILFAEALLLVYSPTERHSFHHFFAARKNFNKTSFWTLPMLKFSIAHLSVYIKYEIPYNRHYSFRSLFAHLRKQRYHGSDRSIFVDNLLVWCYIQAKHRINQVIFDTVFVFDNFTKRRKAILWKLQESLWVII